MYLVNYKIMLHRTKFEHMLIIKSNVSWRVRIIFDRYTYTHLKENILCNRKKVMLHVNFNVAYQVPIIANLIRIWLPFRIGKKILDSMQSDI